LAETG